MNIAIVGTGAMGKVLESLINDKAGMQCVGTIEPMQGGRLTDIREKIDAVIDFSNPVNLDMIDAYARESGCGVVIATTGFTPEQIEQIQSLSTIVPVVYTANFSLGITVMRRVLAEITPILKDNFDMEIIEKHHNKKLDAPSGTAIALLAAMNPEHEYDEVFGREGNRKRGKEIGIHAIRGGTIVGEHTAIYAGEDEIIEITHIANSKKIFAVGAIRAAEFVVGNKAGLYDMEQVLF
ncbi:4-hydroxy-tetrahydrodipicolinate reductase [Clostridium aminobutyricum]|uniref:4-hydroxy-tetrahydrodipicolinate reductase n=1 Tax=Clostridium aminobutyricum TaxID=33953 RepID=A0A939DBF6_CLOAM|nr:4-hydroxy-tetrahydrodipicolinate reductase [Clostridium aminobutyricum]MBN7774620.1 4-hydroxy-tetrahydrodipicolinate reductase [Clostridium aminobutyricum]